MNIKPYIDLPGVISIAMKQGYPNAKVDQMDGLLLVAADGQNLTFALKVLTPKDVEAMVKRKVTRRVVNRVKPAKNPRPRTR